MPGIRTVPARLSEAGLNAAFVRGVSLPAASGGDDRAAIQALLNASPRGYFRGRFGEDYTIGAALIVHSGQTLDMRGCTITLTDGVHDNMVANYAARNSAATGTGSMTAGSNVVTTALASQAEVGQSCYVDGAVQGNGAGELLCGIVGSVDSGAGTLTVTKLDGTDWLADNTVADADVTLYDRDTDIALLGGDWNRGNNGWAGVAPGPQRTTFDLKRIDGLIVRDLTMRMLNAGYNLAMGDVRRFAVQNITLDTHGATSNSDGVNINGGAFAGSIRDIYGYTDDDFVSFHCLDNQTNMNDVVGDITDLVVENICPDNADNFGVKIRASGTTKIRRMTVRGVHGTLRAAAVSINNADGGLNDVGDVLIEDIDAVSAQAGLVNILTTAAEGHVTIRNIKGFSSSGNQLVFVNALSTLGGLLIDGIVHRAPGCQAVSLNGTIKTATVRDIAYLIPGTTTQPMVSIKSGTTIDHLTVAGVRMYEATGSTLAVVQNLGTLGTLHISDVYLNGGGRVLVSTSASSALDATLQDITLDGARDLASLSQSADLLLSDVNVKSITAAGLIAAGSAPELTVRGSVLHNPGDKAGFLSTPPAVARVVHPDFRCDVAVLDANDGDMAWNTNASSADTGPVISDGTDWTRLFNDSAGGGATQTVWGAYKTASTTKNNDNTAADDPHLTIANVPAGVYAVRGWLKYESSTVADFKAGVSAPASSTFTWETGAMASTASSTTSATGRQATYALANTPPFGGVGATAVGAWVTGTLHVASTGTVAIKWAQNTAEISNTILHADSHLVLTQIA